MRVLILLVFFISNFIKCDMVTSFVSAIKRMPAIDVCFNLQREQTPVLADAAANYITVYIRQAESIYIIMINNCSYSKRLWFRCALASLVTC